MSNTDRDWYVPLQHDGGTDDHWLLHHLDCTALHGHKVSSLCSGSTFILWLVWGWDISALCSVPSQVWRQVSIRTSSWWHISPKSLPESLRQESGLFWMYVWVSSLSPGGKYTWRRLLTSKWKKKKLFRWMLAESDCFETRKVCKDKDKAKDKTPHCSAHLFVVCSVYRNIYLFCIFYQSWSNLALKYFMNEYDGWMWKINGVNCINIEIKINYAAIHFSEIS